MLLFLGTLIGTIAWFVLRAKAAGKNNKSVIKWGLFGFGYNALFIFFLWCKGRDMQFEGAVAAVVWIAGMYAAFIVSVVILGFVLLPKDNGGKI